MNDFSWDAARTILDFIALVGAFLAWFYAFQAARTKATRVDIDKLREDHGSRLNAHGERITRVEGRLEAMPTRDDIGKLHGRVDRLVESLGNVAKDVAAIGSAVKAIERNLDLINRDRIGGQP